MVFSRRKLLIAAYLLLQTLSTLTEGLQTGAMDAAVNAVNIVFIVLFVLWQPRCSLPQVRRIKFIARSLVVLLAVPAVLSLVLSGESSQITGAARIWLWVESLLFALAWCDDASKADFLFSVLRRCAFMVLVALLLFNVFSYGETAYGLGHLFLGSILSLPTLSLFVLALLLAFLYPNGKLLRLFGFTALLILIALLLKRSVVVAALVVLAVGWQSFFPRIRYQRLVFAFLAVVVAVIFAADMVEQLQSSELVAERFSDMKKLEASDDLRYLGSGRLRLVEMWWGYYVSSSLPEMLLGQVVGSPSQVTGIRYLGMSWPMPHNDALDVLLRGGLLALMVYIALWITLYRALVRTHPVWTAHDKMVQTIGRLALFVYVIHIPIGVVTKLQFMTVIVLYIGVAIRASIDAQVQGRR